MSENLIYKDEFIKIFSLQNDLYLESFKKGLPLDKLKYTLSLHPEINITNFLLLKNSIASAPHPPQNIGVLKDRLYIETENNDLEAYITFYLPQSELTMENRKKLIADVSQKLQDTGINFGILDKIFDQEIISNKRYMIAKGLPPIDGQDSIIKLYPFPEPQPNIHEDGSVNFYDLKLINRVQSGEWLGEKIDATKGIPGKSVKGKDIKAQNGKDLPLIYDKNTVCEIYDGRKTTLYSKINGAVSYVDGKIAVSNHLEIDGNVDFTTGNIIFDGFITIRGTVSDGFYVEATKDIEINSQLGLGHVKGVVSKQGTIFIKGGISSKGQVELRAAKNIYTKFVENASITCGGSIHVGFYCINSNVTAKEVIIDSSNGQIIGGNIKAEFRVLSPIIGSGIERKTNIEVTGFNRESLKEELDKIFRNISLLKKEQQDLKQLISHLESIKELNSFQKKEHSDGFARILAIKEEISNLEEKKKNISGYLKTKGEGEICITKKLYPNCTLKIKKMLVDLSGGTSATSYYVQNDELKQV